MILKHPEETEKIVNAVANNAVEYLQWYASLRPSVQQSCSRDILYNVYQLSNSVDILHEAGITAGVEELNSQLRTYEMMFANYLY